MSKHCVLVGFPIILDATKAFSPFITTQGSLHWSHKLEYKDLFI